MKRVLKSLCLAACIGALAGCIGGDDGGKYDDHDFGDNDPRKVVALGDSITQGYTCEDETKPYPTRIAEMTGLTVINAGVDAEESNDAARRAGRVLDKHKPGFLLILTGHNDAIFDRDADSVINNIRSIINSARSRKTVPIVSTLVPIGPPRRFATGPAREYSERIRQLAREMNVELVDLEKEFGDRARELQCDGLHPNDQGSAVIAAAFADKLP